MKHEINDWHPADVKAGLAKKGYSFARIAREQGLASVTPNNVLRRHYPRIEAIVAEILGVAPQDIWPSRHPRKAA